MKRCDSEVLFYQRSQFLTRLPLDYLFTAEHCWLARHREIWRVGLTRFGTRMTGAIVEYGFEVSEGVEVTAGNTIGWIEGLKGISDIRSAIDGRFHRSNPDLERDTELIDRDCYEAGWLYEASGTATKQGLDARGYAALLDETIDKLSKGSAPPP